MFTITYTENGAAKRFSVPSGETLVGRGPACGLVLNDPAVSRRHASLSLRDQRLYVRDVGSRVGTYKNDAFVTEETELVAGDTLVLGELVLEVGGKADEAVSLDEDHFVDSSATIFRPVDRSAPAERNVAEPSVNATRLMTLLSEIGKTLVIVRPLQSSTRSST